MTVFRGKRPKQEMKGAGMIYTTFPPTSSNSLTPEGRQQPAASQLVPRFPAHAVSGGQAGVTHSTHGGRKKNKTNYHFSFNNPNVYAGDNNIFSSNILLFLPISESNSFQLEIFSLSHQRKIQ